jgi:lysophospholipase L1-like esterase
MISIKCFGDSLTYGTGSTTPGGVTSYPARLASFLAGQSVANHGDPGKTSAQVLTNVLADPVGPDDLYVFWAGHNDDATARAHTVDNIAAMVAHMGSNPKFLVNSMISRVTEDANTGGGPASRAVMESINAALLATYGAKYVDVQSMLLASYDPTNATDLSQHALNNIPWSLRANAPTDDIHLNDGAYALIGKLVARAVWANGWATSTTIVLRDVIPTPSRASGDVLVVYSESGEPLPKNVLLRGADTLRASYVSAGHAVAPRALLDVDADTAARALL